MPIRCASDHADTGLAEMQIDQALIGLIPHPVCRAQLKPDGGELLSVSISTPLGPDAHHPVMQGLGRLGLTSSQQVDTPGLLFEKTLDAGRFAGFLKTLKGERTRSLNQIAQYRATLKSAFEPGRLTAARTRDGNDWMAGRLVYTGHPMDVAMPDAGTGTSFFIPIILEKERPQFNWPAASRAYTRGGRLYVDASNMLRVKAGRIDAHLIAAPTGGQGMRILPDGNVVVTLADGSDQTLGHLPLVKLEAIHGDGDVFGGKPVASGAVADVVGLDGGLRPGHLEYPALNPQVQLTAIGDHLHLLRILAGIETALAAPDALAPPAHDVIEPTPSPLPAHKSRQIVIAADIPLAAAHLKALGYPVKDSPKRATITIGGEPEDLQRMVASLSNVLKGLQKRMAICQENYSNATRTRDAKGELNPYRRKIVKLGEEGEWLESEDPSPFRKEVKPDHPDADPTGNVTWPNVSTEVEDADYRNIADEYRLLRDALSRIAPDIIFPDPPRLITK